MKKSIYILALLFFLAPSAFGMNLDGVKEHFLKSEWKDAIREGEALLAGAGRDSADLDQLYYYLGLCYLKDGNILRSTDIFEIILKEFPKSKLAEPARKALNDARAKMPLKQAVENEARVQMPPKQAVENEAQAQMPSKQLVEEEGPDLVLSESLKNFGPPVSKTLCWVQVGAFSSRRNADKLASKLQSAGYTVSVSLSESKHGAVHKVRVGSFPTREDAQAAAKILSRQGYPTKVIP